MSVKLHRNEDPRLSMGNGQDPSTADGEATHFYTGCSSAWISGISIHCLQGCQVWAQGVTEISLRPCYKSPAFFLFPWTWRGGRFAVPAKMGIYIFVSFYDFTLSRRSGPIRGRKLREIIRVAHQRPDNICNGHNKPSIMASMRHRHTCSGIMHPTSHCEPFYCRQRSLCPKNRLLPTGNVRRRVSKGCIKTIMLLRRPSVLFVGLGVVGSLRQQTVLLLLKDHKSPCASFLILA